MTSHEATGRCEIAFRAADAGPVWREQRGASRRPSLQSCSSRTGYQAGSRSCSRANRQRQPAKAPQPRTAPVGHRRRRASSIRASMRRRMDKRFGHSCTTWNSEMSKQLAAMYEHPDRLKSWCASLFDVPGAHRTRPLRICLPPGSRTTKRSEPAAPQRDETCEPSTPTALPNAPDGDCSRLSDEQGSYSTRIGQTKRRGN